MANYGPTRLLGDLRSWASRMIAPVQEAPEPTARPKTNDPIDRSGGLYVTGLGGYPDYCSDAPAFNVDAFRQMRYDPMVSFAYGLCVDPITAGERQLVIRTEDGDAPKRSNVPGLPGVQVQDSPEDKRKKAAEDVYETHWHNILEALECLNFGFWVQEVVWDRVNDLTAPASFRSFNPWDVRLIPDRFGQFAGFEYVRAQTDNQRDARYAFHTVCMPQFNPLEGFPRSAVALAAWWRRRRGDENMDRIEQKTSGRQMAIGVMSGQTFRSGNSTVTGQSVAQEVANTQARGGITIYPLLAFDKESIKANPKLAEIPGMKMDMFDWGDTGAGLLAAIERHKELAVEIVRAYNHPERQAMEGTHGTKAEAGVHGEVGLTDSELVGGRFYHQFNKGHFNRFLVTNWGAEAADSMYWKMTPLADPAKVIKAELLKLLSASPTEGPDLNRHIHKRDLLKAAEVPLIPEDQVPEPIMPTLPLDPNGDAEDEDDDDPVSKRMNGNGAAAGR